MGKSEIDSRWTTTFSHSVLKRESLPWRSILRDNGIELEIFECVTVSHHHVFWGQKRWKCNFYFLKRSFHLCIFRFVMVWLQKIHSYILFSSLLQIFPGFFFGGVVRHFGGWGLVSTAFVLVLGEFSGLFDASNIIFFVSMATSQTRFVSRTCLFFNIFYHFRGWFIFTFSVQSHHVPQCFEEIKNGILHWKSLSK